MTIIQMLFLKFHDLFKRNAKISKEQREIVKSEDRQDHGQQNEMKDNHRTHNATLKTTKNIDSWMAVSWTIIPHFLFYKITMFCFKKPYYVKSYLL